MADRTVLTLDRRDLELDVDDVLRGQGADPAALRRRSPHLVQMAERALEEGLPLINPRVLVRWFEVESLRHERLLLHDSGSLSGPLIAEQLGPAVRVAVLLCTVGSALEEYAAEVMASAPVRGLALDGVGSAAIEALANATCRQLGQEVADQGWQTTIPLSPGMIGWAVSEGQPQIFALLDGAEIGIRLNEASVMLPLKSLSMVLGAGPEVGSSGRTCDYCTMRGTCRYQDHDGPNTS